MRFSNDDCAIIHAALALALNGDNDVWDSLDTEQLERASDIFDTLDTKYAQDEDSDDDDEYDDDDGWM